MRPPTGRQLQLAGTQHELFSRTLEHLAHPVCDRHRANGVGARCGGVVACGKIVGLEVVTVARSLRDHRARRPDPGAGKTTLVDDTFHRESGARHVAHAGETPHERTLRFLCRLEVEVRLRSTQQRSHRQRRHHGVDMGVDQPGHQGAPAACDHQRPLGQRAVFRLNGLDLLALHHHPHAGEHHRPLGCVRRTRQRRLGGQHKCPHQQGRPTAQESPAVQGAMQVLVQPRKSAGNRLTTQR